MYTLLTLLHLKVHSRERQDVFQLDYSQFPHYKLSTFHYPGPSPLPGTMGYIEVNIAFYVEVD